MKDLSKTVKPLNIVTWLGIVLFVAGFYGLKIKTANAPVPENAFTSALVNGRFAFISVGIVIFFTSIFYGNIAFNGRFRWGDFIPYLFILPAITFLTIFVVYPLINLIYLSLFKGSILNSTKRFVGLQNFRNLRTDINFWASIKNTLIYTASIVVIELSLAVLFALWVFKDNKVNRFMQISIYAPHLIASISVAFVFSWMFNSHSYGAFNTLLGVFGIAPVEWLDSSKTALGCIIFVSLWKNVGYRAIIILSAMKAIPSEIYEAAELDGSTSSRTFFKITLPMLTPQLFFLLITTTIGSFKVFDVVNIMTDGGPGTSTEVITRYIYHLTNVSNNTIGDSAAVSIVFVIILGFLSIFYFRMLDRKVHYE